eukprot:scpid105595/ scgid12130/ 
MAEGPDPEQGAEHVVMYQAHALVYHAEGHTNLVRYLSDEDYTVPGPEAVPAPAPGGGPASPILVLSSDDEGGAHALPAPAVAAMPGTIAVPAAAVAPAAIAAALAAQAAAGPEAPAAQAAAAQAQATAAIIAASKRPSGLEYTAMVTWPSNNMGGFDKE